MSKNIFDYGTERLKEIEELEKTILQYEEKLELVKHLNKLDDDLRSKKVRKLYKMWLRNQGEII